MNAAPWYCWQDGDLLLTVRVQPRAKRDELAGVQDGRLRVRLSAPPVEGQANDRLRRFLADLFQAPYANVLLLSGAGGRDKRLRIRAPRRLPAGVEAPRADQL